MVSPDNLAASDVGESMDRFVLNPVDKSGCGTRLKSFILPFLVRPHALLTGGRGSGDAGGGSGSAIHGAGNSLAVAVYDGHGGDAVSKELERVLLNVSRGRGHPWGEMEQAL